MNQHTIKWILFTVLAMTVPAMFFLFVVVMFVPAAFFVAGIGYVLPKLFTAGHAAESLSFIVLLGVHALFYAALYYGVSVVIARGICLMKARPARISAVTLLCLAAVMLTQFPVYGGGGHGPMHWYTLAQLAAEVNNSYGSGSVPFLYGTAALLISGLLISNWRRKYRSRPAGGRR